MRATARLTRAEFAWAFRALLRAGGRALPGWSWLVLAVSLALGIVIWDGGWFGWILVVAGALGLFVSGVLLVMPFPVFSMLPDDRRTQTFECSPTGISSGTDDATVSYTWSAVSHVVRGTEATLLVTHRRGEGILMVHRVLTDDQRRDLDALIAAHAPTADSITV